MHDENDSPEKKIHSILVVDDDRDVLDELEQLLVRTDKYESEVVTATSGDEAIELLDRNEFDLVLADFKMPGMNGVELLSVVKEKYPETIRILITGYSDINIAKEAINWAEVHAYIEKPWDNEELRLTIQEALSRKYERESANIKVFERVKDALDLMEEVKDSLIAIPAEHISKQVVTLQFNSPQDFNKFSFALKRMKGTEIQDVQIFEEKHIITLVIKPDRYVYI